MSSSSLFPFYEWFESVTLFWSISLSIHSWIDRRVVFTGLGQDTIYLRTRLVLTNLLITSLLVLCFSQWFLLFLPPKILLISCRPIDSYSDICYLGTDELIIFVSFLWMIWVDLPFLIYLSIAIPFVSTGSSEAAPGASPGQWLAICHVIRYPRVINV